MRRRLAIPLLIAATLLAAAAFLPRTPVGRGWLLARAVAVADGLGYQIDVSEHGGDPWRGVTLHGASVAGPGIDITIDRVDLDYFLPALLTGALPLDLAVERIEGSLSPADLEAPSGGGGAGIAIDLRSLDIDGVALDIDGAALSLPELTLERLASSVDAAGNLRLDGVLVAPEGRAPFSGGLVLDPLTLDLRVEGADLSLARHWWAGVLGGALDADLHYADGALDVEGWIRGGAVELAGARFSELTGRVRLRDLEVEANLDGEGLGGTVSADGTVDITGRSWRANYRATPTLQDATAWLLPSLLDEVEQLGLSADLAVQGSVGGWLAFDTEGIVRGVGELLQQPLDVEQLSYAFGAEGLTVDGELRWAQSAVGVAVAAPGGGDLAIEVAAEGLVSEVAGIPIAGDADLRFLREGGIDSAVAEARLTATLADRPLRLEADATLDADGWQTFVSGADDLGGTFEGAAVLGADGLRAGATLVAVSLPGVPAPLDLAVRAEGTLANLALSADVTAPESLRFDLTSVAADIDPRGSLRGRYQGGVPVPFSGALGPLSLSGTFDPAGSVVEASYRLAGTPVELAGLDDPLSITVAAGSGRWSPSGWDHRAELSLGPARLGPAASRELTGVLEQATAAPWTFRVTDDALVAELAPDRSRVTLSMSELPLEVVGTEVVLSGTATLPTAEPLPSLSADLAITAAGLTLEASAAAGDLSVTGELPAGFELGPATLAQPLTVRGSGTVDLSELRIEAEGAGSRLELTGTDGTDGPLRGSLITSDRVAAVELDPTTLAWSFDGDLDLSLLALVGLDASGSLSGSLSGVGSDADGTLIGSLRSPIVADVALTAAAGAVEVESSTVLVGTAVAVGGQVWPGRRLQAQIGSYGAVQLDGDLLTGAGELPGLELGPLTYPGEPWELTGSLAAASATITAGRSHADLSWRNGWRIVAEVDTDTDLAGRPLAVVAAAEIGSGLPRGALMGRAALGSDELRVSGSLDSLAVAIDVAAAAAAELAGFTALTPAGRLTLSGNVTPLSGPALDLTGSWATGSAELSLSVTGVGSDLQAQIGGIGLSAVAGTGGFDATLDRVDLAALFHDPPAQASATGTLAFAEDRGWSGDLALAVTQPLSADARLIGRSGDLMIEARWSDGGLTADAEGTLLPTLALSADLDLGGFASARLVASGGIDAPTVTGSISAPALSVADLIDLPAVEASIAWEATTGVLSVDGERVSGTASLEALDLALELPLRVAGTPHVLRLDTAGSPADPSATATLDGPLITGSVDLVGSLVTADLQLDPSLVPVELPDAVTVGPVAITGTVGLDGSYRGDVTARIGGLGLDARLDGSVEGQGPSYRGSATLLTGGDVADGARLAEVEVEGRGVDLTLSADLGRLDATAIAAALGLPVIGTTSGTARLSTSPPSWSVAGAFTGSVAGTDLTADGAYEGGNIDLALSALGLQATVGGTPERLDLSIDGDLAGEALALSGAFTAGSTWALDLEGVAMGRTAAATASLDPIALTARFDAELAGVELRGRAEGPAGELRVTARLESDDLIGLGPVDADLALRRVGGGWHSEIAATLTEGVGLRSIELAGPLLPESDLRGGAVLIDPIGAVDLVVRSEGGPLSLLKATVQRRDLSARIELSGGRRLDHVALLGSGDLTVAGVPLTLSAGTLAWRPDQGFEGEARVVATVAGLKTATQLRGEAGDLVAAVAAERSGLSIAGELRAGPRPWDDPSIAGELTFEADAAVLPQTPIPVGATLVGGATVSGSWRAPVLDGVVDLGGPVAASGVWSYRAGGGSVQLDGDGLALSLFGDPEGWRADLAVERWPLGDRLPWFDQPLLAAHGAVAGDWDGSLIATLDELAVAAGASRVDGQATLQLGGANPSYTAVLRVDLDLADARISPALRGRVRGPVALTGASLDLGGAALSGLLSLADGGAADSRAASLAGTLQLSGNVSEPIVAIDLEGLGTASGRLRGQVRPLSAQANLESDLDFGGIESDLHLELTTDAIDASGSLAYQDFGLRVSTDGEVLALRGAGRLDGVSGWIDPVALTAVIEGELAGLVEGAAGRIALDLSLPVDGLTWLRGTIVGADVAGVSLGDLALHAEAPIETLTVQGDGIAASVGLDGGFAWDVEFAALPLTSEVALTLAASGAGLEGSGSGRLVGSLSGEPVDLAVTAANGATVSLEVIGDALGGRLTLDAALVDDRWEGAVTLDGASLAGQRIDLDGSITGASDDPTGTFDATSTGTVRAVTELTVTRRSVTTTGRIELPGLPTPLTVEGTLWPAPALSLGLASGDRLRVSAPRLALDADLGFAGRLSTDLGVATVEVVGDGRAIAATVRLASVAGLIGIEAVSEGLAGSPLSLLEHLEDRGLRLNGVDRLSGSLALLPFEMAVEATDLRYRSEGIDLLVTGRASLTGRTELSGLAEIDGTVVPFAAAEHLAIPFALTGDGNLWQLTVDGERGTLDLTLQRDSLDATLRGDLAIGGGTIVADLALADRFAAGRVSIEDVRLSGVPGLAGFALNGTIDALGERLSGRLDLDDLAGRGGIDVELNYPVRDLLIGVPPLEPLEAEARIRTFAVGSLPVLAERVPNLVGEVSGIAQLRSGRIVGRVVAPGLAVFDTDLPTDLEFNGSTRALEVRGSVAGSALSGTLTPSGVSALLRFERFPLQSAAEAVAGRSDISAELTGVARLELPFGDLAGADLRVATELIRLERDGVVTTGNATFDYLGGALTVERVAFEGAGRWEASGVIRSDTLDFRASAEEADFGPLLGIVPALAQLDAGARGSLELVASGSLDQPGIDLRSEALEISLAGSSYRLDDAVAVLNGRRLRLDAGLVGLSPIVGSVEIGGGGTLSLAPLRLEQAAFDLDGSATVPILGEVTDLVGTITAGDGAPMLRAEGRVGNPFTIEGSLLPLDLRLVGDDLAISAPTLLLASSVMDADVRISYTDGLDIGGDLLASEARFQLGIRPASTGDGGGSRSALERVRFADLGIEAPGRIFFNESFATIEARASLTLGGSAAAPQLSGNATALRGSIRFSGRDFAIERGIATFEPARGAYPLIDMLAVTSFDKARVIPAGSGVRFVEPRASSRFDVRLGFQGALEARRGGGFDLDFDPDLSSDALIEVAGEAALTSGPRPLTPSELLALVTLGRLDISSILAGNGGLVTAVAQGALDTAVDLLVLAELQQALSEALGVEVVEIRTTALSSLLDGDVDDPFGVSLRLGGYLSEELFASFQIGSFDDEDGAFALTNEVRLTYALGPVEFDLAGGVNVAADESLIPIPELSSSVRYGFNALLGIEAGVDLSSTRSQFRVGLTVRW